jgi:hypothetical protein
MSEPIDQTKLGPLDSPSGGVSALRIGFFVALGAAIILAGCQVALYAMQKPGDLSGIITAFLLFAGGSKVGQSFAERT